LIQAPRANAAPRPQPHASAPPADNGPVDYRHENAAPASSSTPN